MSFPLAVDNVIVGRGSARLGVGQVAGAGEAQSIKGLLCKHENPTTEALHPHKKPGTISKTCNLITWEMKTGGLSGFSDQPG